MLEEFPTRFVPDILKKYFSHRTLIWAYICFSLITGLFVIFLTPPFQVADEPNHFMRAIQIANGGLVAARRTPMESGGLLPESLFDAAASFSGVRFSPQNKVTPEMMAHIEGIRWGQKKVFIGFPNTVIYPPTSYIGVTVGILFGRLLHSSVLGTLYLARIFNLLVTVGISASALTLVPEVSAFLAMVLILPMSLSLMASCSQDGMVLALTAFAIGTCLRWVQMPVGRSRRILSCLSGIAFGCIAAAKAPYVLLVFVPALFVTRKDFRDALASCVSGLGVFAVWIIFGLRPVMTKAVPPGVEASRQIAYVLHHPFRMIRIVLHSIVLFGKELSLQLVGVLGWLDLHFPNETYVMLKSLLLLTFFLPFVLVRNLPTRANGWLRIAGLFTLIIGVTAGIYLALYVTWTPVAQDFVEGIQGRYFLPVLMMGTFFPFLWKRYDLAVVRSSNVLAEKEAVTGGVLAGVLNALLCGVMVYEYFILCHAISSRYW